MKVDVYKVWERFKQIYDILAEGYHLKYDEQQLRELFAEKFFHEDYDKPPIKNPYKKIEIFDTIDDFKIKNDAKTIPFIIYDKSLKKFKAIYSDPVGFGKQKGKIDELKPIDLNNNAIDVEGINNFLGKQKFSDKIQIINMYDSYNEKSIRYKTISKNQLKELSEYGFGFIVLDKSHIAVVPLNKINDGSVYSFEFETNIENRNIYDKILFDYEKFIENKAKQKLGFKLPFGQMMYNHDTIFSSIDFTVRGKHPIELVHGAFTLPTLIFTMYHWSNLMKDFVTNEYKRNKIERTDVGLHISATIPFVNKNLLQSYLYGIRLLDTLIFRKDERKHSHEDLMSNDFTIFSSTNILERGMFRVQPTRLEVRYFAPQLEPGYLINSVLITSKYVDDINKLNPYNEVKAVYPQRIETDIDNRKSKLLSNQAILEFYMEHILQLKEPEKQIFREMHKSCNSIKPTKSELKSIQKSLFSSVA